MNYFFVIYLIFASLFLFFIQISLLYLLTNFFHLKSLKFSKLFLIVFIFFIVNVSLSFFNEIFGFVSSFLILSFLIKNLYRIKVRKSILISVLFFIFSFILYYFIFTPSSVFIIKPFYVQSNSMEPTLYDQDYILADCLSYRFKNPQRGDIVVFKSPINSEELYIKRLIGLPKEKIKLEKNGIIIFNGKHPTGIILEEGYIKYGVAQYGENEQSVSLGEDEYFLMGDNRNHSLDSRFLGKIKRDLIIGRIFFRVFPAKTQKFLEPVNYKME